MRRVAFHNLGCKVNTYEFSIMQQNIQNSGYEIVDFTQEADIYIVNTCSVTNIADRKSRQMLHKAKKQNPNSIVVAVGCYAQTDTKGASEDEAIDIIVGNNRKADIVQIIEDYIQDQQNSIVVEDLSKPVKYEEGSLVYSEERTRVDIKIQDGCNQFCTYCIIPYARGRVRSRDKASILAEINELCQKGFREMVLTGIHLSSYGLDFRENSPSYNSMADKGEYTNEALIDIIDAVSEIEGIERIRLGSLEPRVITRAFLAAISANKKVCPHFHLSLQSGCDGTLKRMNRHYTADEYYSKVELIREYYEHPAITTDIIVGFPGETEEEFNATCEFVDRVKFYETHIFKYSIRKGTPAATMSGQLTDAVKSERSDVLQAKNEVNSEVFRRELTGKMVTMLTEEIREIEGRTYSVGHTPDYVMVACEGSFEANEMVSGIVTGAIENGIMLLKKQ